MCKYMKLFWGVACPLLTKMRGGGLFITLTPIFHPLLHFPGQRQNHFFILCIRQRKPWTPPPQGSTQIRRRDVESWGVYFQGLVNLDLINFLTMWIFTLCEFRPGESWTNAVYISSENVLNTKIDCSKNVLLIVVLIEYKLKWTCC